jgi:hypothetical protein
MSPEDMAFIHRFGCGKRRRQDLLIAKQKVKLHEHQLGNHNFLTRADPLEKPHRFLV